MIARDHVVSGLKVGLFADLGFFPGRDGKELFSTFAGRYVNMARGGSLEVPC
jgi:hypothetical protein